MPIHESYRVEHHIVSGHINIVTDDGEQVPAYSAHPSLGQTFAGVCLLHDWWGMTNVPRLLSNFFAQMGYYVIAPDMFMGAVAKTPKQAMALLQKTEQTRFTTVNAALTVLENHHRVNSSVALIGLGMGGTLAFEAAIKRDDLEAAVSYGGFPQRYLGQFDRANTPILAIYGSHEPHTKPIVVKALRDELSQTALHDKHELHVVQGAGHAFFSEIPDPNLRDISKQVVTSTLNFLEHYLDHPEQPRARQRY